MSIVVIDDYDDPRTVRHGWWFCLELWCVRILRAKRAWTVVETSIVVINDYDLREMYQIGHVLDILNVIKW